MLKKIIQFLSKTGLFVIVGYLEWILLPLFSVPPLFGSSVCVCVCVLQVRECQQWREMSSTWTVHHLCSFSFPTRSIRPFNSIFPPPFSVLSLFFPSFIQCCWFPQSQSFLFLGHVVIAPLLYLLSPSSCFSLSVHWWSVFFSPSNTFSSLVTARPRANTITTPLTEDLQLLSSSISEQW